MWYEIQWYDTNFVVWDPQKLLFLSHDQHLMSYFYVLKTFLCNNLILFLTASLRELIACLIFHLESSKL